MKSKIDTKRQSTETGKNYIFLDTPQYSDPNVAGYNPSLRAGTRVLTSDGVIPIEQLENKFFKTRNINGSWSYARCWKSGVDKPLYRLTLSNGKEYFCTAEHKWPVLKTEVKYENKTETSTDGSDEINDLKTKNSGNSWLKGIISPNKESENNKETEYKTPVEVKNTTTTTTTRTLTTDIKTNDRLPYTRSRGLCNPVNGIGTYTDGFSLALLYCSPTVFVSGSIRTNYVWVLTEEAAKGDYGSILTTWMNSIDYAIVRTFEQKDEYGNNFLVITQQSEEFTKYMSRFGLPTENEVRDKTYGVPKNVWTGTEDFRRGFIDGLYSYSGGIDENKGLAYISSSSETFVRDIWDLLGFYGVYSTQHAVESSEDVKDTVPLVVFDGDIFSQMFRITSKEKQDILDNIDHKKHDLIGEIEISKCELTDLKEDVWDVTVYDKSHMFALSHCLTGNCGEQSLNKNENSFLSSINPSGCVNPMTVIVVDDGNGIENQTFNQIFKNQNIELPPNEDIGENQMWYDVTKPFKVLDENNKMQNAVKLYDNGVRDTVHLKVNNEDIFCTPHHKFKIRDEWVQAVDLVQGDIVKCY